VLRVLFLLPLLATLGGCMTAIASRADAEAPIAKLQAESKSIVLLHTSLHDERCDTISARLAKPNGAGRYVWDESVVLKGLMDFAEKTPSQIVLPAGEYGIVQLRCGLPRRNRIFNARVAVRGSILDNSGTTFERPIATFKVGVGEVVDIGSLRLPTGRAGFIPVVTPIPEPWLNNLAISRPDLYKNRVVRPMAAAIRI
jgi:hypothetical protein